MASKPLGTKHSLESIQELLPIIGIIVLFPIQFSAAWLVFMAAQTFRFCYRILMSPAGSKRTNLKVLVVTDYMPPQTHGIAIRFARYVDEMRKSGHEAHVFTTAMRAKAITSFDHPVLPCISNPYNNGNSMAYCPGIKLAWYLGAYSWDVVHIAYPSTLGWFILPACRWRSIPTYCSHHVDMDLYMRKYMPVHWVWYLGSFFYCLFVKYPAIYWASINTSMTQVFLKAHLPQVYGGGFLTAAIPTGIADDRFCLTANKTMIRMAHSLEEVSDDPLSNVVALRNHLTEEGKKMWVMVQRLALEKDIHKAIEAMPDVLDEAHLVIAGGGPDEARLKQIVAEHRLEAHVTMLGNVPNVELPRLYRMADCFITCSISETFGLTSLESLACCTPVAYPSCPVFDELWKDRLPAAWRYVQTDRNGLIASARVASSPEAKAWLTENPVNASWRDATHTLVNQYKDTIKAVKKRKEDNPFWSCFEFCEHLLRVCLLLLGIYFIGKSYSLGYQTLTAVLALASVGSKSGREVVKTFVHKSAGTWASTRHSKKNQIDVLKVA